MVAVKRKMQIIRCTKKLQKEMGLTESKLSRQKPAHSFLGSWHANLIHINGRKCVLFTNDKTLFNFIAPELSRKLIRDLKIVFQRFLEVVVSEFGFGSGIQRKILEEYKDIEYSHSNNKKVLGSMNDLVQNYKYRILSQGGLHSCDFRSIIKEMNQMPMGALKYEYPIEILRALCGVTHNTPFN